ncbi:hypothetical protein BV20DRAFT_1124493 [Pilatotrama ljubarskyi]|nr:hypothetical protein BV20DRAFT_1124493 [Pilatotrama ljubarskyi]
MVAPWDIYAAKLFPCGYGHPLWIPEPSIVSGEIQIGDVGYLDEGRFHFLFHAMRPSDDPVNIRGTPANFVPFRAPSPFIVDFPNEITQPEVRSEGIQSISMAAQGAGTLEASAAGQANAQVGFRYQCTEQSGALLMLKRPGHSKRLVCDRTHLSNWHAFATHILGIDLKESDILFKFVSGFVKTTTWAEAAFTSKTSHGELFVSGGALVPAASASVGFSASLERCEQPTIFYREGPIGHPETLARVPMGHETSTESTAEQPFNQCIFLNYFIMKTRAFWTTVMRAVGGEHELPEEPPNGGSPSSATVFATDARRSGHSGDHMLLDKADSVEVLLDYILEHSDSEAAAASDRDITNVKLVSWYEHQLGDIKRFLKSASPETAVVRGVGSLVLHEDTQLEENTQRLPSDYLRRSFANPYAPEGSDSAGRSTPGKSGRWAVKLHEFCQKHGLRRHLTCESFSTGPLHLQSWIAIYSHNGVEYGRGTAATFDQAKEMASQQALLAFKRMLGYAN